MIYVHGYYDEERREETAAEAVAASVEFGFGLPPGFRVTGVSMHEGVRVEGDR